MRTDGLVLLLASALLGVGQADDGPPSIPPPSMRGHLEAFGRQGPSLSIDVVEGFIPPKEFVENYVMKNRPLLFRGAATKSPAFSKWTDEYFAATAPPRPAGDVFIEHKKKENRSQTYSYVHFGKFLEVYNTSDIYMVSDVPEQLLPDLILPFSLQCRFFLQGGLDTHVVWFSSGGTSSVIHNDAYENINCLYRGRKSLVFLNTTRYPGEVKAIIDRMDGAYSSADVDKIDLLARPEFRDLEFHQAEMNTGDCLYIPLFWVHQVRSFENNLAVNIWWPPREEYPLGVCAPKYSTNLNFAKIYFKTVEESAKSDVESFKRIIDANLAPNDRTEADLLTLLSGGNPDVAANKDFTAVVSALFKTLDVDMDGSLSFEELMAMRLKRKQYRPIRSAITNYNVLVFRMHEGASADAAARLPKLLPTSGSDASVFAAHRTWPPVETPTETEDTEDADVVALTGSDASEEQPEKAGEKRTPADDGEKRDEL